MHCHYKKKAVSKYLCVAVWEARIEPYAAAINSSRRGCPIYYQLSKLEIHRATPVFYILLTHYSCRMFCLFVWRCTWQSG